MPDTESELRVAFFIIALQLGGAERLVMELIRLLNADDVLKPYLILQRDGSFDVPKELSNVLELGFDQPWRHLSAFLPAVRRLRRFIRANQIDVLHTHWWLPDLLGALATIGTRTRHILHLHTMCDLYMPEQFRLRKALCKFAFRRARSKVVSCSEAVGKDFIRCFSWPSSELMVLPNAVDTSTFATGRCKNSWKGVARNLRIGIAGRLVPSKGHLILLDAFARFLERGGRGSLDIAGDGECRALIEQTVQSLDLENSVNLLGPVDDMPSFYRSIDVLVQPSTGTEGLPMTILEAMSSGCLVIASDTGGACEALSDTSGFLLPPGEPAALADCLLRLAADPAERLADISAAGQARIAQQFSMGAYIDQLRSLYRIQCR